MFRPFLISMAVLLHAAPATASERGHFEPGQHMQLGRCIGVHYADVICADRELEQCEMIARGQNLTTTGGAYSCGYEFGIQADRLLNQVYGFAILAARRADDDWNDSVQREESLRQGQRHWIKYRDATCSIRADWLRIGPGYDSVIAECAGRLSFQQMQVLYSILKEH